MLCKLYFRDLSFREVFGTSPADVVANLRYREVILCSGIAIEADSLDIVVVYRGALADESSCEMSRGRIGFNCARQVCVRSSATRAC